METMKITHYITLSILLIDFYSASVISPKSTGCAINFCSGNGNCASNSTGHPSCSCLVGYTGDNCEIGPCELLDPCSVSSGRGECAIINQEPVCSCKIPWYGNSCETCDCGTHGTCDVQTFNGITGVNCVCDEGYHGLVCDSLYCSGNGAWDGTSCDCFLGFAGVECDMNFTITIDTTNTSDEESSTATTTVSSFLRASSFKLVASDMILTLAFVNWLMMN